MNKLYLSFFTIILQLLLTNYINSTENNNQKVRLLPKIRKIEKNNKRVAYTGSISMPEDCGCSQFFICYNGKLIKILYEELSSFVIKDFDNNEINILFICPSNLISKPEEQNTLFSFKVKKNSPYKYFKLNKTNNENEYTWKIKPFTLDTNDIEINTFIILINPEAINFTLKNVSWKKNSSLIELPKIVINCIKDQAKLTKSCLSFMDIKPFHIEQDKKELVKNNVKISILL